MEIAERNRLVDQYETGYQLISEALAGIADDEWDTAEAPGEWTPRQVAHHLGDSEMTAAIRVRRLIAEDNPEIIGYDQEQFASRLYYARPVEPSLAAFKAAREATTPLLRSLTDEEWARSGTHNERGAFPVLLWLTDYANHAPDHAAQIRRARAVYTASRGNRDVPEANSAS